ncbi:phage lysis regulatory protein, LysB family [compost metagenome]
MSIAPLVPAPYRLAALGVTALLLGALGAGLAWWGLSPRIQLQSDRADHAEQGRADAQALVDLQAGVLAEQQRQIGAIVEVERRMRQLGQQITRNAAEQAAAIEELKRHDQEVADYLRGAVPAALGRLYARPETTDPAAYHGPAGLPADPVSAARPPSADGER